MFEYIDILTLGLTSHRVNVVAHVAHTTAMFGLNTFHYIDPKCRAGNVWIKHLPLHNLSLTCAL
jgi:hypothetical protein